MARDSVRVHGREIPLDRDVLDLRYSAISTLEEIEFLFELKPFRVLILEHNYLKTLAGIERLQDLEVLNAGHNNLEVVDGIGELVGLRNLTLSHNPIATFKGLEKLIHLASKCDMFCAGNDCIDMLTHWPKLKSFNGSGLNIVDASRIQSHDTLTELVLSHNQLADLRPMARLSSLRVLNVDHNLLTDLEGIQRYPHLQILFARWNRLRSVAALEGHPELQHLRISFNRVKDPSPLATVEHLRALYAGYNMIEDPASLRRREIRTLLLYGNPISPEHLGWLRQVDESIAHELSDR